MAVSRRKFIKSMAAAGAVSLSGGVFREFGHAAAASGQPADVFFSSECSVRSLCALYEKISQNIHGRTAIKVHTGEPHGPNIIPREWVRQFMQLVPDSRIVECNVLYASPRQTTEGHRKTLEINGWTEFTEVDIMDEFGDADLPITGGKHLRSLAVGKNLLNYDSMIVLTHFKGHVMGGFGGSLKNISIGCASGAKGKEQLHCEGANLWSGGERFMERMVEGGKAITDHFGKNIVYINVLRNMSVSCDCEGTNAEPVTLPDLGILASTDILAVDKASVDMVYALPPEVRAPMQERIESRSGLRQLSYMQELGMGSAVYTLHTI